MECKPNLIPQMNTPMTINFQPPGQFSPRSLLRSPIASPESHPLIRHPKWAPFVHLVHNTILKCCPDFRPYFLELLDQADLR